MTITGMRRLTGIVVVLLFATRAGVEAADPPAERPNIILIMADDLGFSDLGCYGSEIETPTLDRLAQGGLRFRQFYNTAKCHSSRVCLLSGLYCQQAGNAALDRAVTLAEVLKQSGYFTAMSGKWHLKKEPTDRGFDRYFGHLSGSTNFFIGDKTFRLNGQPFNEFDDDFYTTDANTDYALRFVDEATASDKPFFLYLAYNAPHYPLHVKRKDFLKYQNRYRDGWDTIRKQRYARQLESGLMDPKFALSDRPAYVPAWDELSEADKLWEQERMAAFAGMVDCLDQNIARLVNHLKATGQFENTLLMFCSDNGACPFERTRGKQLRPWDPESYWCYDSGWAHVGNTPFRWYKQNQHEGGISSPLIVHWPAGLKTEPGSFTNQPGHLIDFMPTLIDVAGASYPTEFEGRQITPVQGKSLLPIFQGQQRPTHNWMYFMFSKNRAIRQADWKIVSANGGRWELYDIRNDRSERHDLATLHPDKAEELIALWHEVAANVDRLPIKQRGKVSPKPPKPSSSFRADMNTSK
ncbi:MAG: arylsulfatase [Phycisphaera sp. RhM]|nr:arylsulfatase [Phycisphaera sp. RhM]